MLQASLRVVGGKHDGELVPMASHRFLIGREEDCHLRPNNDMVSRHHCAFTIDDYSVRLRDLGSTNGTLVNGNRLRGETHLKAGDRVTIGKLVFELEISSSDAAGTGESAPAAEPQVLQGETAELSSDETTYDLPAVPAGEESETTVIPPEPAPAEAAAVAPEAAPAQAQPAAAPQQPGYPQQQPGYYPQQPMGYPQQPMGYPQPGYYMQQPMGYPQQPGYFPQYGYAPQMLPGQPVPAQFQPPAEAPAPAPAPAPEPETPEPDAIPDVRLPDPSQTGVASTAPQAPAPKGDGEAAPPPSAPEKNPSDHAADIIRQHMNRRPTVEG